MINSRKTKGRVREGEELHGRFANLLTNAILMAVAGVSLPMRLLPISSGPAPQEMLGLDVIDLP